MAEPETGYVRNRQIKVNFYDTAGSERYDAITKAHYRKSKGAFICYSVNDRSSFEAAEKWIN